MRITTKNLLLVLLFLTLFSASGFSHPVFMQVKIKIDSPAQLNELRGMGLDIISEKLDYVEVLVEPDGYEKLQSSGYSCDVVHADLTKYYQSRLEKDKDMGGYLTLSELNAWLDQIIADHPDIVSSKISIGQTIEGRDQWAVKISDNPEIDEDEPEVLFTAAIHAREVITPLVVLNLMDSLTDNYSTDTDIQDLVDNREIWFVACCNPDGYYNNEVIAPDGGGLWRKNMRDNGDGTFGVDLNRNFGFGWGYNDYGSSPITDDLTYRGTAPFSEPETQNLRDFHNAHDFIIAVYFHSYGNRLYGPWGYISSPPRDSIVFNYICDSVWAVNGYANDVGVGNINGCTDDWVYGETTTKNRTFAFTNEIGHDVDGFWPQVARIPSLVNENVLGGLAYLRVADDLDSVLDAQPPYTPSLYLPAVSYEPDFEVSWTFDDIDNPAVEFELLELTEPTQTCDSADDFSNVANYGFFLSTNRYYSPPTSFFGGGTGSVDRNMNYYWPHQVQEGDTLRFKIFYDLAEHRNYAYVIAYDIQADSFSTLPGNLSTTDNPYGQNIGNGITGSSGGQWVDGIYDLSSFAGLQIAVILYHTDYYFSSDEGVYFDDIYAVQSFLSQDTISISGSASSVLLTEREHGIYCYSLRAKDDDDQYSGFATAQQIFVDLTPQYICGDANADGMVNVSDAVSIINFVFAGGAEPQPYESGDTNCDITVNVSDAVWIINFVFTSGNSPCDSNGDDIPDC